MSGRPTPGDPLGDEDGRTFAVVITRGWTDDQIYDAAEAHHFMTRDETGPYRLTTWHNCTAAWRRDHGISQEYDAWWSEDGDGRTTIDVAVWP